MLKAGRTKRTKVQIPTWVRATLIAAVGALAYASSLTAGFVFDDKVHIHANPRIQSLWPPWALLSGRRPVVDATLAVNYALGGLNPAGYHALNVVIHILAALVLYGLLRGTLRRGVLPEWVQAQAERLALSVALLWVVHPLLTQGVTYVIQRGESLMGLFYLLTLYCLMRGSDAARPRRWYAGAVASCGLGMASKSVMITAPIVALLYDRVFLGGSFGRALRMRWLVYAGVAATWLIPVLCGDAGSVLTRESAPDKAVGFGYRGISPAGYALTQPVVILYYLRLVFWPHPLCLDYAWPASAWSIGTTAALIVVVSAAGLSVAGAMRGRPLGFAVAFFFLLLAPTSSVVPIRDVLVEHRMYLSLAAVLVIVAVGTMSALHRRKGAAVVHTTRSSKPTDQRSRGAGRAAGMFDAGVAVCVVLLAGMTARRNLDYRSELAMWRNVVEQRPGNARGHLNLGVQLDDPQEAAVHFQEAVKLRPDYSDAWYNLGLMRSQMKDAAGALEAYRAAVRHDPKLAPAWNNLGKELSVLGQVEEEEEAYRRAIEADPAHVRAYANLATNLYLRGDSASAVRYYRQALELDGGFVQARISLGRVLLQLLEFDAAIQELGEAVRRSQGRGRALEAEARFYLGEALERAGRREEAIGQYKAALQVNPNHKEARRRLSPG